MGGLAVRTRWMMIRADRSRVVKGNRHLGDTGHFRNTFQEHGAFDTHRNAGRACTSIVTGHSQC